MIEYAWQWEQYMAKRIDRLKIEVAQLKELCGRAAEALGCHNLDHLQDDLIEELRKAAG